MFLHKYAEQVASDTARFTSSLWLSAGVYVWGKDWIHAKTQAECYDYLFEAAVKMSQLGIKASLPPAPLITNGTADGKRPAAAAVMQAGETRMFIHD